MPAVEMTVTADAVTNGRPLLFSAFIMACGITHLMDIWTIWRPDHGLLALTRLATPIISTVTAVTLWWLIPKVLKIPSIQQLQSVIGSLEAEVERQATDAVTQDRTMPQFDGFAVLNVLRQMPAGRDIPVFIGTRLMLSDDEHANLARSTREILSRGGGGIAQMLDSWWRWRPSALSLSGEGA